MALTKHAIRQACVLLLLLAVSRRTTGFVPSVARLSHQHYYSPQLQATESADTSTNDLINQLDDKFSYEGRLSGFANRPNYRCGFVAVIGAPNMGKSTLLNALVQHDLCIATARPQTTRHAILGLLTTDACQACLVDTPGVIDQPAYKLQENMMEAVVGALKDADVLLVVTDLFSTPIPSDSVFQKVLRSNKPVIVAINKVDLAGRVNTAAPDNSDKTVTIEQAVAVWRSLLPDALAILPVCASDGPDQSGVVAIRQLLTGGPDVPGALRNLGRPITGMYQHSSDAMFITNEHAMQLLPKSPPLYDAESLTDRNLRFIASEIIRAALFETLNKELPYCCEVRITQYKEPKNAKDVVRIEADIVVERDSQKVIVIGRGGEQVKNVGMRAREKLEDFIQEKVYLKLNVKVNKDWRKRDDALKQYGYSN